MGVDIVISNRLLSKENCQRQKGSLHNDESINLPRKFSNPKYVTDNKPTRHLQ